MRFTCQSVKAGSWQSTPCIVVTCHKDFLGEELCVLAGEDGRPFVDKLMDELLNPRKWSDKEIVPSPPVAVRVLNDDLTFTAEHLNVKYSTRAVVVELFVLDATSPFENMVGKEIEVMQS
jgi:hypothetical protein